MPINNRVTLLEHLQLCREYRGIWAESKSDTYGYLFGEAAGAYSTEDAKKALKVTIFNSEAKERKGIFNNALAKCPNGSNSYRIDTIAREIGNERGKSTDFCKFVYDKAKKLKAVGIELNANEIGSIAGQALYAAYEPLVALEFQWQSRDVSRTKKSLEVEQEAFRKIIGIVQAEVVDKVNVFTKEEKPKVSERKFVVNQEYSYNTFVTDFVNLRCELRQAWYYREKFEEKGVEYDKAKTDEEKSSIQKELFAIAKEEDKCYDKAKAIALEAINRYWDLHKTSKKNLVVEEEEIKDKQGNVLYVIQRDASGRIILPIGESFYPFMFEVYFRSHTPFDIAFDKGRGLQAKAKKERDIRERIVLPDAEEERKRVAEYLDQKTNEFRNFKDRLEVSKEDHMTPKLRAHMEGGYYEMFNHKYPEVFELLSRSKGKWNWDKIITDCLYRYTHYIDWANEHREYGKIMQSIKVRKEFDQHNAQSILATGDINTPALKAALKKYEGR